MDTLRASVVLAAGAAAVPALAAPADDPLVDLIQGVSRAEALDVFLGDGEWSPPALAWKTLALTDAGTPVRSPAWHGIDERLARALAPERAGRAGGARAIQWAMRPTARAGVGGWTPPNQGGNVEDGLASVRGGFDARLLHRGLELAVRPEFGLDAGPWSGGIRMDEAWAGWRGPHLVAGFGRRDRWIGPGRRGALLLSDNAASPPMGTIAGQGRLPGRLRQVGQLRLETSLGWFDRPREDVDHPLLLLVDARWLPVPGLEIGVTRLSMFGGEGRPLPSAGQILLPTHPHVHGDPEKEEPDQNEQASIDVRGCLPLARLAGGPVDWIEGWWQYGAEDLIVRDFAGVSYPSLAGVAHLYGFEAGFGPFAVTVEGARILDDTFRWYTGHRVYHDGFTQDGRVLGHEAGGDATDLWARVAWHPKPHRWHAEAWGERILSVGVVESQGGHLFALAADELRWRAGVRVAFLGPGGGRVGVGYTRERIEGAGFVPGADEVEHHVAVAWTAGPLGPTGAAGR